LHHLGDLEVFGDRIGEQALTHLACLLARRRFVLGVDVEDEMTPDVHGGDAAESEGVQGIGDGLALRIEQTAARDDLYCDAKATHSFGSDEEGGVAAGPGSGDESCGGGEVGGGGAGAAGGETGADSEGALEVRGRAGSALISASK
jgi:hypothetical protein